MRSLFAFSLVLLGAVSPQVSEARSAGCGTSPTSSGTKSMTVNGKTRQYILQLPNNYDSNTAYKLIFGYHWLGGNMQSVADGQYYGLRPLSGDTAIFVAPDGLNNGWGNSGGEDVTFTDQMLNVIKGSLCVDETNIFATGWSYGGSMSFSLACSRPNVFKAVAVIAGAQLSGCNGGNTPVPYLGIHGSADNVLPISLGRGLRDKFIGLNGCQSQSAPEPAPGAGNHIKTVYSCNPGFPVWWIAHGGGHVPDPKDSGQGQSWAPGETWSFFTQSGLGGGGGGPAPSSTSTSTSTASQPTTSTPPTGNCSAKWGQCGGQGWSGPTCCQSGSTCQAQNQWYSQCL